MSLPEWLRLDTSLSSSHVRWGVLGGTFVLLVIVVTLAMVPGDVVREDRPYADWNWTTTTDGDFALTHEGGDTIPRETLRVRGDALDGTVSDLGDGTDERIAAPFDDRVVSRGDTLVLDQNSLRDGTVVLHWKKPDGSSSATLAQLDYPADFESTHH